MLVLKHFGEAMKIHLAKLNKIDKTTYEYKFDNSWRIRKVSNGWIVEKNIGGMSDDYKKVKNLEKAVYEIELFKKYN